MIKLEYKHFSIKIGTYIFVVNNVMKTDALRIKFRTSAL